MKTTSNFFLLGIVLSAFILISACQSRGDLLLTYDLPLKPDDQVTVLVVPNAVEIIAVDGTRYEAPYTDKGFYEVHLLPGKHEVDMVYSEVWGDNTTNRLYVSDRFRFGVEASAGARFVVKHNGPENLLETEQYQDSVRIWLVDALSGNKLSPLARFKHGNILNRAARKLAYGEDEEESPVTQKRRAVVKAEAGTPTLNTGTVSAAGMVSNKEELGTAKVGQSEAEPPASASKSVQAGPLQHLQEWWKRADKEQRLEFRKWIIDNP